jgi:hypothetical protein
MSMMNLMPWIGIALLGGSWGAGLAWWLLRPPLRRQALALQALQRRMEDLQGQYWALQQCLLPTEALPRALPASAELPAGSGLERLYDRAIRMARQGARADALMGACGLSRAEAELVVRLHALPESAARQGAAG